MTDRESVDAMARILAAMNGDKSTFEDENAVMGDTASVGIDNNPGAKTDAMKAILEAMNGAVGRTVVEKTNYPVVDLAMEEAIVTEAFDDGIRIGEWEIRTVGKNLFDVARAGEFNALVREITLYEAAVGLVRLLNNGKAINSPEVLSLLNTEQTYASNVSDAIRYATLVHRRRGDPKVPVWEARYSDSKMRAAQARAKLCERVRDLSL